MPGKRWSPSEDSYLAQWYPRRGGPYCAQALNRSLAGVYDRARRLALESGIPNGMVPLSWIAPADHSNGVRRKALRDAELAGVLVRLPTTHVKLVVPEWWADQYADKLEQERDAAKRAATWLTTQDVADLAGVDASDLTRTRARLHRLYKALEETERVKVYRPVRHWRWHPAKTRRAVQRYLEAS